MQTYQDSYAAATVPIDPRAATSTPFPSGGGPAEPDPAFSVSDIIALLRKRILLISTVVALLTLTATLIVWLLPNQYTAISRVMVDARDKVVTNVGRVMDSIRVNSPAIESEVEIIASNAIALRVIDKLGLRSDPEFGGFASLEIRKAKKPSSSTAKHVGGKAAPTIAAGQAMKTSQRDYVLAMFQNQLEVQRVRNSQVIEISFTSTSPAKAARIANAIAEAYIAHELDQKIKQSEIATNFLKEKLKTLRNKVAATEQAVQRFKAENNLFDSDGRPLSEKRLARLMEQTVSARNATAQAKSKFLQLRKMMRNGKAKGSIADVLKSHTVRMLKEKQAKIAGRTAELRIKYGPRHPTMMKARAELRDIEMKINEEVDQILSNLKNEYDVAVAREATLTKNLLDLERKQGQLGQMGVKLAELEREATTSRQLYEAILARYKQTAETQSMQLPDSRVVEAAAVPLFPSAPKRKRTVALAFVGATAIAFGLALLLEFYKSGFATDRRQQRQIRLEQVASLPRLPSNGQSQNGSLRTIRMVLAEPRGEFTQSIETLVMTLDDQSRSDGLGTANSPIHGKIVQLASSLPGEGRTTIASNLAHLYALSGRRTLLIDADLRRSNLTSLLAPSAHAGLHDCIAAGVRLDTAILHDAKSQLHFLPSRGPVNQSMPASAALSSPQIANLLKQLRSQFEIIVIDTPPLLPVVDGRVLARQADQILFVMSWRRTPKELARRAVASLNDNADKIVGVVANQVATGLCSASFEDRPETTYVAPQTYTRAA